ncbi:MAG: DNA-binding protein [Thermoproteota archaeon]|nr:DNA-binding protein [Thermoproteota archaeon]
MVNVILDSNFLFAPLQFKVDIFEELINLLNQHVDFVLLSPTREELQKLAKKGSPKLKKNASLALKLAEKCRVVQVNRTPNESYDDVIVRVAKKWKCPVATNDRTLKKKLRDISVPVIYLRQKSRLEMDGSI